MPKAQVALQGLKTVKTGLAMVALQVPQIWSLLLTNFGKRICFSKCLKCLRKNLIWELIMDTRMKSKNQEPFFDQLSKFSFSFNFPI